MANRSRSVDTAKGNTLGFRPVRSVPLCPNGVLDPGEACDDGNDVDWDGCSNACEVVEAQVNTTTSSYQTDPRVEAYEDGRFVVVWRSENQDGSGAGVIARLFAADGTAAGAEIAVNQTTADTQHQPDVATFGGGGFVVAWRHKVSGSDWDIYVRRFDAAGAPEGDELRVNSTTAGDQRAPRVAAMPDGSFMVVWWSVGQDGDGGGVFAQRYAADGSAAGGEVQVNATSAGDQQDPAVAASGDGFATAWHIVQDRPYIRLFDPAGAALSSDVYVGSSALGVDASSVTALDNGSYLVVWDDTSQILARRISPEGVRSGDEVTVSSSGPNMRDASAAPLPGGGAVAVYEGDAADIGVYAQRLDAGLATVGSELAVNTYTDGFQKLPDVASFGDGSFVVVWQSDDQDGSWQGIYALRYRSDGEKLALGKAPEVCNGLDDDGDGSTDEDVPRPCRRAFVASGCVRPGSGSDTCAAGGDVDWLAEPLDADVLCRSRASTAGLPRADSYIAYLSHSSTDAYCHLLGYSGTKAASCGLAALPTGGGPWLRTDGLLVASDIAQITGGECDYQGLVSPPDSSSCLSNPVVKDETGADPTASYAWTGTYADGTASSNNCDDWTSGASEHAGSMGTYAHAGRSFAYSGTSACNVDWLDRSVYCFERGLNTGDACTAAADCESGYCVDGVCCSSLCAHSDRSCNVTGSVGTCAERAPDTPDLLPSSDTNINTDDVTYDDTPTFGISGLASGDTVDMFVHRKSDGLLNQRITQNATEGTLYLTAGQIPDGEYLVTAAMDLPTGARSATSQALTVTIDTTPSFVMAPDVAVTGGTGTDGTFIAGDQAVATWNNSATGANSGTMSSVVTSFFAIEGAQLPATDDGSGCDATAADEVWTACFTLPVGTIDKTDALVWFTTEDLAGNSAAGPSDDQWVDNEPPTVTAASFTVSGDGGDGVFDVGDTITVFCDGLMSDSSSVSVNFFGIAGATAVQASIIGTGQWTATHRLLTDSPPVSAATLTVTDDAGNVTTATDDETFTFQAVAESCDNVDNDLDGDTDEDLDYWACDGSDRVLYGCSGGEYVVNDATACIYGCFNSYCNECTPGTVNCITLELPHFASACSPTPTGHKWVSTPCEDNDPCTSDSCVGGTGCVYSPRAETCNAIDDDCDGQTDEGLSVGGDGCWHVSGVFTDARVIGAGHSLTMWGSNIAEDSWRYALLDGTDDSTYTTEDFDCTWWGGVQATPQAWHIERTKIDDLKTRITIRGRSDEDCDTGVWPRSTGAVQVNTDAGLAITRTVKCSVHADTQGAETYCNVSAGQVNWQSGSNCGGCCACPDGAIVDIEVEVSFPCTGGACGLLAPDTPDLQAASDTGLNTDDITYDDTPSFDVSGVASGDEVDLLIYDQAGQTLLQTRDGTASGSTITLTTSALAEGVYQVKARRDLPDGTRTIASDALTVTIDTTAVVTTESIAVTGATGTGGTFKIGDEVSVEWDNSATGDDNGGIYSAAVDFSGFGGGASVSSVDDGSGCDATAGDDIWTACITLVAGALDHPAAVVQVSIEDITFNEASASSTPQSLDIVAPEITTANITVSGDGEDGVFDVGDTATVTWDNSADGDFNGDIASVAVDFFGISGATSVSASDPGATGIWSATHQLLTDSPPKTAADITVTDDAGNTTTVTDDETFTFQAVDETCDGVDNDLDGDTDEDVNYNSCADASTAVEHICSGGEWTQQQNGCQYGCYGAGYCNACTPDTKKCTGLVHSVCSVTATGYQWGDTDCDDGDRCTTDACNATSGCTHGTPAETCNAIDDDCDGETDEGLAVGGDDCWHVSGVFTLANAVAPSEDLMVWGAAAQVDATRHVLLPGAADDTYHTNDVYCEVTDSDLPREQTWHMERTAIDAETYRIRIRGKSDTDCDEEPVNAGVFQVNTAAGLSISRTIRCDVQGDDPRGGLIETYCNVGADSVSWQAGADCSRCCLCADGAMVDIELEISLPCTGPACVPPQANGASCLKASDCISGNCVVGICVAEAPLSERTISAAVTYLERGHTCAVASDATIKCWGSGSSGVLGNGTNPTQQPTPVTTSGIDDGVRVVVGHQHTCAIRSEGSVVCWGYNGYGTLGDNSTTSRYTPVAVTGLADARDLAAGQRHTCAARDDGSVWCWGQNGEKQLGNPSVPMGSSPYYLSTVPVQATGVSDAITVEAGLWHTCALRATGGVLCWGAGQRGQLGNGNSLNQPTAVEVSGLTDAKQIAAGGFTSCALRQSGGVLCWGYGADGQLGNGGTGNSSSPTAVSGLSDAIQIAVGEYNGCALRASGSVVCWGSGDNGAIGNGTSSGAYLAPTAVSNLTDATQISTGDRRACAWRATEDLVCWGSNNKGQLGNGTTTDALTPTAVSGF